MQTELTVITKAKDLCSYILTVTEKSPKRFRFTLTSRMQNLSLELIEQIYRANEVYLSGPDREAARARRLDLQHGALTSVKLLGWLCWRESRARYCPSSTSRSQSKRTNANGCWAAG